MGRSKKQDRKPGKRPSDPRPKVGRRRFLLGTTGIVVAGITAGFGVYRFTKASNPQGREKSFTPFDLSLLPRRETRGTLSPALFTGRVAAAYAVARRIPALLDQLYCYCRCKENFGHKSLLSCFVGRHAST